MTHVDRHGTIHVTLTQALELSFTARKPVQVWWRKGDDIETLDGFIKSETDDWIVVADSVFPRDDEWEVTYPKRPPFRFTRLK